jgi:hypothetical protein
MKAIWKLAVGVTVLSLMTLASAPQPAKAGTATSWPVSFSIDADGYSWVTGSIADTHATSNSTDRILCWYVASQGWLECRAYQYVTAGATKRVGCGTSRAWSATFAGINPTSKVTFRCGPGGVLDFFEVANGSEFIN